MADKAEGFLLVGNKQGEVIIDMPPNKKRREQHKADCAYRASPYAVCDCGIDYEHIVFSPDQARSLGLLLINHAARADGYPGTKEDGEFFIEFNTVIDPGKIQAVRVRLDLVTISNMNTEISVGLNEHPLFQELVQYVKDNEKHDTNRQHRD